MEARARRLSVCVMFLLVLLAAVLIMGQAAPEGDTLEAEKLVIRDRRGLVRAELGMVVESGVALKLWDERGGARVQLVVGPEGSPILRMYGESATSLLLPSRLTLLGSEPGKPAGIRLDLGSGLPNLSFLGTRGTELVQIGLGSADSPRVMLNSQDGTPRAALSVDQKGLPRFSLYGGSGGERARLRLTEVEGLELGSAEGSGQWSSWRFSPGIPPSLVAIDREGKVLSLGPAEGKRPK